MWCGQDISIDIKQLWLLFNILVHLLLPLLFPPLHFSEYFSDLTEPPGPAMALQPTMDAPKFKGTAVVNGQFKEISLDDYKGNRVNVVG